MLCLAIPCADIRAVHSRPAGLHLYRSLSSLLLVTLFDSVARLPGFLHLTGLYFLAPIGLECCLQPDYRSSVSPPRRSLSASHHQIFYPDRTTAAPRSISWTTKELVESRVGACRLLMRGATHRMNPWETQSWKPVPWRLQHRRTTTSQISPAKPCLLRQALGHYRQLPLFRGPPAAKAAPWNPQ